MRGGAFRSPWSTTPHLSASRAKPRTETGFVDSERDVVKPHDLAVYTPAASCTMPRESPPRPDRRAAAPLPGARAGAGAAAGGGSRHPAAPRYKTKSTQLKGFLVRLGLKRSMHVVRSVNDNVAASSLTAAPTGGEERTDQDRGTSLIGVPGAHL